MKKINVICVQALLAASATFALASAQVAQAAGVLIYGRGADSVSLDPGKETDGESLNVAGNIFDTLVQFKPGTTEVVPGLAEKWEISTDKLTYTFKLRPGVKFHDGTPFNADAVIFSLMRQHDPKHEAHSYAKNWSYWNDMGMNTLVKSISKTDDLTVVFTLSRPEAPFIANLAMPFASIVSPAAVRKFKEDFAKKPVGTGPFVFASWTRGERIILNVNKNYWNGQPSLDRVIFRSIPDSAARLNAFLAKEINVMNLPTPDQIAVIKQKRGDAKILDESALNVAYLAMNNTKAPFNNVKVRQAINMAINKDALIKGIYAGMGKAAVNPMPPTIWGYNNKIQPYAYNVQKAKALLKEAGFANGFKAELYFPTVSRPYMPDGKRIAEAIQADLKKIGIDLSLQTYEWATYLDKTGKGEHQMALLGWTGDNGDPDNFLSILLSGENTKAPASNIAFYNNPKVTELLNKAKVASAQKERASLYMQAQELIHADAPWVPLAHSRVAVPMDKKVQNFVISPLGTLTLRQVSIQ